jgi:catalase (peroxidase I)
LFSFWSQIFGTDYNDAPLQDYTIPFFRGPTFCTADKYNSLAQDIKALVANETLSAPTLFRLGFHHCNIGTAFGLGYGCNGGWLHYDVDAQAGQNAGLPETIDILDNLRDSSYPCITYADLYTFSGALGLELGGGPPIAWYPGRADPSARQEKRKREGERERETEKEIDGS